MHRWLSGLVDPGKQGFVRTGHDVVRAAGTAGEAGADLAGAQTGWRRSVLESSCPGIFAVGDVRNGSASPAGSGRGTGVAMLHVQLNLITADPRLLGDSIKFIENEVRPSVESQPGSLGLSLQMNPELGVAILESFWVSGDALRASERVAAPSCAAAVRRVSGTVTVERYAVPVFEQEAPPRSGECGRLTRMDVLPSAADDAVEVFGDTVVRRLADTDGFCSACSSWTGTRGTRS